MTERSLEDATRDYYTAYYRDELGLPDWAARIQARLDEEQQMVEPTIRKIEQWIHYDFSAKRVLIVGAGTGGEAVVLARRNAEVFGVEPSEAAYQILSQKVRQQGLKAENFSNAFAEDIPHAENKFDFVYCYTVLEHVRDVEKSIDEMVRVCRPGGTVFIQTPDYRFPYEGHYKLLLIPFAPRWMQRLYLRLLGRPTQFYRQINLLTGPQLDRIFWKREVIALRIVEPHLRQWFRGKRREKLLAWFSERFAVPKHQNIFLIKQGR